MSHTESIHRVKFAILIIFGLVIALLITGEASAAWPQASKWKNANSVWINFVTNNEKLRIFDQTQYDNNYDYGRTRWNKADKVKLTWNQSDFTVVVYDGTNCAWSYLAATYEAGYIENNRCLMNWQGGIYPGYGRATDPTLESRRTRIGTHELGHALGFKHWFRDGVPCASLMSETLSDRDPGDCIKPSRDDIEELQGWH